MAYQVEQSGKIKNRPGLILIAGSSGKRRWHRSQQPERPQRRIVPWRDDQWHASIRNASLSHRLALAQDGSTDTDTIHLLAYDPHPRVQYAVARHPRAPSEAFERLRQHPDPKVRSALAGNPNLKRDMAYQLVRDKDVRVRRAIAGNPNASPEAIFILAQRDPDATVRREASRNPSYPSKSQIEQWRRHYAQEMRTAKRELTQSSGLPTDHREMILYFIRQALREKDDDG